MAKVFQPELVYVEHLVVTPTIQCPLSAYKTMCTLLVNTVLKGSGNRKISPWCIIGKILLHMKTLDPLPIACPIPFFNLHKQFKQNYSFISVLIYSFFYLPDLCIRWLDRGDFFNFCLKPKVHIVDWERIAVHQSKRMKWRQVTGPSSVTWIKCFVKRSLFVVRSKKGYNVDST